MHSILSEIFKRQWKGSNLLISVYDVDVIFGLPELNERKKNVHSPVNVYKAKQMRIPKSTAEWEHRNLIPIT